MIEPASAPGVHRFHSTQPRWILLAGRPRPRLVNLRTNRTARELSANCMMQSSSCAFVLSSTPSLITMTKTTVRAFDIAGRERSRATVEGDGRVLFFTDPRHLAIGDAGVRDSSTSPLVACCRRLRSRLPLQTNQSSDRAIRMRLQISQIAAHPNIRRGRAISRSLDRTMVDFWPIRQKKTKS
jgi:hypothetical protein